MFDVGIRSYLLCINFSAHYFPKCVYHLWKISGEFFRCIVCIFVSSNKNTSNFFLYDLYLVYLNFSCYFSRLKPIHWKGVERVDIFFLLLDLVSMFWVFSQLGMLVEVLLYIACIMLRYIPCTCRFANAFTIKENWILSEAFSTSTWILLSFLSFSLLMWWVTVNHLFHHPCIILIITLS